MLKSMTDLFNEVKLKADELVAKDKDHRETIRDLKNESRMIQDSAAVREKSAEV